MLSNPHIFSSTFLPLPIVTIQIKAGWKMCWMFFYPLLLPYLYYNSPHVKQGQGKRKFFSVEWVLRHSSLLPVFCFGKEIRTAHRKRIESKQNKQRFKCYWIGFIKFCMFVTVIFLPGPGIWLQNCCGLSVFIRGMPISRLLLQPSTFIIHGIFAWLALPLPLRKVAPRTKILFYSWKEESLVKTGERVDFITWASRLSQSLQLSYMQFTSLPWVCNLSCLLLSSLCLSLISNPFPRSLERGLVFQKIFGICISPGRF